MTAGVLALVVSFGACKKESAPGPDVWAAVNGKEIKRDEVEKYFRSRTNPEGQEPSQEEALSLKLNIIDELINNEILLERAKKMGLEAGDGEVEDKFTEFKSPFTEDEFQRQLKERGVTVDDLKRDLRRQLTIQKLINREVVAKVSITDQDVNDFYNQNRAQFNVVEPQYRVSQIVITPRKEPQVRNRKGDDATTDAEARRKAAALLAQIHEGADFAQVAMDYSEDPSTSANGGDLGYIPESALGQADPALKKTLASLRPGEVSPVVALRDGYRILKLIARESPGQRELSDPKVQQSIRDALRNRKEQLLRSAYLSVARDEATVKNFLAQQVLESAGKLPAGIHAPAPAKQSAPARK
ncbi:MAG: peptidylprolyl isomerase [Acidobacteria bacterium]|nr:peptidylprolyl isomerase [Acidobacteriota bacterium]